MKRMLACVPAGEAIGKYLEWEIGLCTLFFFFFLAYYAILLRSKKFLCKIPFMFRTEKQSHNFVHTLNVQMTISVAVTTCSSLARSLAVLVFCSTVSIMLKMVMPE